MVDVKLSLHASDSDTVEIMMLFFLIGREELRDLLIILDLTRLVLNV